MATATAEIQIGADGVDAEDIVRQIRERVERRRANGEYDMSVLAEAERYNLSTIKEDADFFERYLRCLRLVTRVDINDFEIVERRARFAPLLKGLKKAIWSLLRFYTWRLWSQQNQVNGMLQAAVAIVAERDDRERDKLAARVGELEARLAALEKK